MATKMDCLESVFLEADVASVEWTSISQDYQDLQIIASFADDGDGSYDVLKMIFNDSDPDSEADYCFTELKTYWGNNFNQDKSKQQLKLEPAWARGGKQTVPDSPHAYGTMEIWIYDYTSTAKNKTISVWAYVPFAYTNYQEVQFVSGAYTKDTAALDQIKFYRTPSLGWLRGSTFSLYGVG